MVAVKNSLHPDASAVREGVFSWPSTAPGPCPLYWLWVGRLSPPDSTVGARHLDLPAHQNHIQQRRCDSWNVIKELLEKEHRLSTAEWQSQLQVTSVHCSSPLGLLDVYVHPSGPPGQQGHGRRFIDWSLSMEWKQLGFWEVHFSTSGLAFIVRRPWFLFPFFPFPCFLSKSSQWD